MLGSLSGWVKVGVRVNDADEVYHRRIKVSIDTKYAHYEPDAGTFVDVEVWLGM